MSFLRRAIKAWFSAKSKAITPLPQRVLLVRSPLELEACQQWSQSSAGQELKQWVRGRFNLFLQNSNADDEYLDFLDTPSSKGFVIHFSKTSYTKQEVVYFFDFLMGQVMSQNYKTTLSDLRSIQRGSWMETIQRHYLKPRSSTNDSGLIRQRFGNVTIELILRNDKVYDLRLIATAYSDHLYQDAWDFRVLMDALVG